MRYGSEFNGTFVNWARKQHFTMLAPEVKWLYLHPLSPFGPDEAPMPAKDPAPGAAFDLQRAMEDLERLTGFGVAFHNVGRMPRITPEEGGAPPAPQHIEPTRSHLCDFCEQLKSTETGTAACRACDMNRANRRAGKLRRAFRWRCHGGLEEVVVPVIVEGRHVGTLFGGQARPLSFTAQEKRAARERWKQLEQEPAFMERLLNRRPPADREKLAALSRLLSALAEHAATQAAAQSITRAVASKKRTPVEQALALMVEHLEQPLSLEEIAERVHLSPSRLSHLFTQTEGESFRDRLLRLRMERAKNLLAMTPLPVGDVARRVGYEDPNFFSRIFRAKTGRSPQAYRRKFAKA